jgi:hypothetical protein
MQIASLGFRDNEEGQRYALAELEPSVTLSWIYAVTTSSRDARERSVEPVYST